MNNYVRIFDTTLRDGEQSPGSDDDLRREIRDSAPASPASAWTLSKPDFPPLLLTTSKPSDG